jgi:hypothetical protein
MVSVSTADSVPLPMEIDDENFPSLHSTQSGPSLISFFNCSVNLYEIAQEILLSFYSGGGHKENGGLDQYFLREQSIFMLDSSLCTWYGRIPSHLRIDFKSSTVGGLNHTSEEAMFRRQAVVLYLRSVLKNSPHSFISYKPSSTSR